MVFKPAINLKAFEPQPFDSGVALRYLRNTEKGNIVTDYLTDFTEMKGRYDNLHLDDLFDGNYDGKLPDSPEYELDLNPLADVLFGQYDLTKDSSKNDYSGILRDASQNYTVMTHYR